MKSLLKPTFAMSFLLMLTGLMPFVRLEMAILGLVSLCVSGIMGIVVLGSEDRNYLSELERIRLEYAKAVDLLVTHERKYQDLETRISKALSENRELAGRLR